MRHGSCWLMFFLVLDVFVPSFVGADETGIDETQRWVPSFAITSGIVAQKETASVETTDIQRLSWATLLSAPEHCRQMPPFLPGQDQNPVCPIILSGAAARPSAAGSAIGFAPLVGGNIELMTPGITSVLGRPRGFAQFGVEASFGFDFSVANEGAPGYMGTSPRQGLIDLAGIFGRGSRTSVEIASPLVFAGAGVAFTAEVLGRRLRIKPSFEWMHQSVKIRGETNLAVQQNGSTPTGGLRGESYYDLIYLTAERRKALNGIGPGLELEMDTVRWGPIVLTLGIFGRAYHFVGARKVTLHASGEVSPLSGPLVTPPFNPPAQAEGITPASLCGGAATAPYGCRTVNYDAISGEALPQSFSSTYAYEQKPWSFRGGVALRFRYAPE